MAIQAGSKMPSGVFGIMSQDGAGAITTEELFAGKKVVLVSVPGAFTATCSTRHLPGFLAHSEEIFGKGVDTIAFMAVNDISVMNAWGENQQVGSTILMLADGNGEYAEALGIIYDGTPFGMGMRGRRAAFVVEDGTATHVYIEAPGKFEVTTAESVLSSL